MGLGALRCPCRQRAAALPADRFLSVAGRRRHHRLSPAARHSDPDHAGFNLRRADGQYLRHRRRHHRQIPGGLPPDEGFRLYDRQRRSHEARAGAVVRRLHDASLRLGDQHPRPRRWPGPFRPRQNRQVDVRPAGQRRGDWPGRHPAPAGRHERDENHRPALRHHNDFLQIRQRQRYPDRRRAALRVRSLRCRRIAGGPTRGDAPNRHRSGDGFRQGSWCRRERRHRSDLCFRHHGSCQTDRALDPQRLRHPHRLRPGPVGTIQRRLLPARKCAAERGLAGSLRRSQSIHGRAHRPARLRRHPADPALRRLPVEPRCRSQGGADRRDRARRHQLLWHHQRQHPAHHLRSGAREPDRLAARLFRNLPAAGDPFSAGGALRPDRAQPARLYGHRHAAQLPAAQFSSQARYARYRLGAKGRHFRRLG